MPYDMLVFGGTGDLALHKLLPALYHLHREDRLHSDLRILALSRKDIDRNAYLSLAERHCRAQVARADFADETWQGFAQRLDYFSIDATRRSDFAALAHHLGPSEGRGRVHYLATAPNLFEPIASNLESVGLAGDDARIVLEKPIGHSLESARAINAAIGQVFPEARIYRIDHYLGKETVQNLMALRFANALFGTQWNQNHISHVEITVAERVGIEGRWGYFDDAGQLRDMVQNHLLQLVCLIAMDPPANLDADAIRDEKVKVLRALKPCTEERLGRDVVRGQDSGGTIDGSA